MSKKGTGADPPSGIPPEQAVNPCGDSSLFCDGEKVLCFHGPLIYEAKINKVEIKEDGQHKYFIHYHGWNKNWDEWASHSFAENEI